MRVQDGDALLERAPAVSEQVLSGKTGPVTLGYFTWLDEVIFTWKKIILEILFIIFHGHIPLWVFIILLIIDELINLLKTLVGGALGMRMAEVADEASRAEVNFLREMTALAALRGAQFSRRTNDDEAVS